MILKLGPLQRYIKVISYIFTETKPYLKSFQESVYSITVNVKSVKFGLWASNAKVCTKCILHRISSIQNAAVC